jgi:hypothetical protein
MPAIEAVSQPSGNDRANERFAGRPRFHSNRTLTIVAKRCTFTACCLSVETLTLFQAHDATCREGPAVVGLSEGFAGPSISEVAAPMKNAMAQRHRVLTSLTRKWQAAYDRQPPAAKLTSAESPSR